MTRSTRVLAHPDGSFTVEWLAEVLQVDRRQELSIPKRIKQWAQDPGFAQQPGFIGQHTDRDAAIRRANGLAIGGDDDIYSGIVHMNLRDEDLSVDGVTLQ